MASSDIISAVKPRPVSATLVCVPVDPKSAESGGPMFELCPDAGYQALPPQFPYLEKKIARSNAGFSLASFLNVFHNPAGDSNCVFLKEQA